MAKTSSSSSMPRSNNNGKGSTAAASSATSSSAADRRHVNGDRTTARSTANNTVRVHVVPSDSTSNPIVCSFPGGLPESLNSSSISNGSSESVQDQDVSFPPKFQWQRNSDKSCGVVGRDEACTFTSINASSAARKSGEDSQQKQQRSRSSKQSTQLAVGIYDRQTGKVTLHLAAENGTVFCLQQHVTSYVSSTANDATTNALAKGPSSAAVEYRALFEDFGSAKKRRVMQSQEANRVTAAQDDVNDKDDGGNGGTTGSSSLWTNANMSESNRNALLERRAVLAAQAAAAASGDGTSKGNLNLDDTAAVDEATMTWRRTKLLPPFTMTATRPIDVYKASDICGTAVWAWTRRHVQDVWNNGRKESSDLEAIGKALFRAVTVNSAAAAAAAAAASTTCSSTMTTLAAGGGVLAATNPQQWTESVRALLQKLPKTAAASLSKERVTAMQNQLSCAVVLHHFVSLYKLWHKQRFIPQSMMFEEEQDEQNMDTSTTEVGSSPSRKQALRKRPASLSTPLIIRQRFLTAFATQTSSATKGRPGGLAAESASSSPGYAMSQVNQEYCLAHILLLYLIAHYKGDAIGADRNSQASASGSSSSSNSSNSTGQRKQRNDESSSSSPTQPLTADHVERLVQDLNVEAVHAMQLLRQAGCTVTRASTSASTKSTMTVTLSTPLTFPQPRRKKASTKR